MDRRYGLYTLVLGLIFLMVLIPIRIIRSGIIPLIALFSPYLTKRLKNKLLLITLLLNSYTIYSHALELKIILDNSLKPINNPSILFDKLTNQLSSNTPTLIREHLYTSYLHTLQNNQNLQTIIRSLNQFNNFPIIIMFFTFLTIIALWLGTKLFEYIFQWMGVYKRIPYGRIHT